MEQGKDLESNWFFKQNSELELVVSAAVVFATFRAGEAMESIIFTSLNNNVPGNSKWLFVLAVVGLFFSRLLPISIIAHFVLRFYWLSLIGLRSAYKEKPEGNPYNEKFGRSLSKTLNLDRQIEAVDRISSSIFAFSFMILFAFVFSVGSVMAIVFILLPFIAQLFDHAAIRIILSAGGNIFLLLCLIYMIDFFTLGWFKQIRNKWFVRIYYPIYRFMGWVTFSYLYKGIYYHLIRHHSRKWLAFIFPIYVLVCVLLSNMGYSSSRIYDGLIYDFQGRRVSLPEYHYADQFTKTTNAQFPFIKSNIIPEGQHFLELHIPITGPLEDSLLARCSNIHPMNKARGINWRKYIQTGFNRPNLPNDFNALENAGQTFDCLRQNTQLWVNDSLYQEPVYYFREWPKPARPVFYSVIDIGWLPRGENKLIFKFERRDSIWQEDHIPFWRD